LIIIDGDFTQLKIVHHITELHVVYQMYVS